MSRIIIIGAGPGGICSGIKLKEAGYHDFRIIEQSDGVGGTWRLNSYPGCRCDVPSVLYSFSFAPKMDWSSRYAAQPEILAYLEELAEKAGLAPHLMLNTRVVGADWDEQRSRWTVTLDDGTSLTSEILVSGLGLFNEPTIPDLPGLETFRGPVMHAARWDHELALSGKRVAVIGTGASAVQFAPQVAGVAGHLDIYQRSPNYVRVPEPEYTPAERARMMNDPDFYRDERQKIFDWIEAICEMSDPEFLETSTRDCLNSLELVEDPDIRERLRPDFPYGAKRPLTSRDWFPTFNRENVALVTDPILRVGEAEIELQDGTSRPTDIILFGTGFETTKFLSAIPVRGRGARLLEEEWNEGARAYRGVTVSGFPNLFMLYGPNTNNGAIILNIEHQVAYMIRHLQRMDEEDIGWIDVRASAMDRYNAELQEDLAAIKVWNSGVNYYYFSETGLNVTQWPHGMERMAALLAVPDYDDYEFQVREDASLGGARLAAAGA